MNWKIILITFAFTVLGYLIGSVSNSVWITRLLKIKDIREYGSKNAGSTNALRVHGTKVGLSVFTLDVLKSILAMTIAYHSVGPDDVIIQVVGIGVVIGHIFPIFHKFKGGKGAACMLGVFVAINWTLLFIGALIFFAIVLTSKKVSLGSIFAPILLVSSYSLLSMVDEYRSKTFEPITNSYSVWINVIALWVIILIVIASHKSNIKRLLNKQERSISFK